MSTLSDNIGDTYKVLREYLPRETALQLAEDLKLHEEDWDKDKLVKGDCLDFFNPTDMSALSIEKIAYLNEFIGGPRLLPTYTYGRVYKNGSSLPKHVDKNQCEVSLSIHLDGDAPYAFHIYDKNGEVVSIDLEPGDAVLYDGINAEHWRDSYEGESYVQTFHHYVFSPGEFEKEYKVNYGNLREYIKVYRGLIPADVCNDITTTDYANRWETATTITGVSGYRVCDSVGILTSDPIDSVICGYVTEALNNYAKSFPDFNIVQDEGYFLLRYKPGGKYDYHTDQHKDYNREVTIILNLNDEYEGGELLHCNDKYKTTLGVGDVCIFPSNFMFAHRISELTSGTRYAIVTWAV